MCDIIAAAVLSGGCQAFSVPHNGEKGNKELIKLKAVLEPGAKAHIIYIL